MAIEVRVPELGESVLGATVHHWLKHEGDPVSVGEALVELETDKVNLEVGAEQAGILSHINVEQGADVEIGEVLGVIEPNGEGKPSAGGGKTTRQGTGDGRKGDERKPEARPEVESDRETDEIQSDERATPVAKRFAHEQGINPGEVPGTGPGGRVMKRDVQTYLTEKGEPVKREIKATEQAVPSPGSITRVEVTQPGPLERTGRLEQRIKMSRRRRTIAHRLVEAQQSAAMLTTFNEIDMQAVMDLRAQRNEAFLARHGVKLGITSFFVKAAIGALKAYPQLNAEVDGDEMVIKGYYDIGIAIGDPEGLVVPVLRDADRMSFVEIERKIRDFAQRAQERQLALDDLVGGTFSITNGGIFGSMLSTPILNPPQVGILGLHKIERRPVIVDDAIVIRPMMYVALSYDHRIVDGREAVQFLVRVKEFIEDPNRLLLEG
jgi:2-oxoglutarate dehydrogenase E2 component (dihydrolipoamide succinyltransferase)